MCPKLIELLTWKGPTVHVCCFMLARASTKTFVSRIHIRQPSPNTTKKSAFAKKFISRVTRQPRYHCTVEQLNPLDSVVMEEPSFLFPSELSNFSRKHFHFQVSTEHNVPDVPRCIDYVPENFLLKSLYDINIARFCASPQLYGKGPHRLQYLFVKHQPAVC